MPKVIMWDIIGPDQLSLTPECFPTRKAAEQYLATWIERYRQQGYYSSPGCGHGPERIPVDALYERCEFVPMECEMELKDEATLKAFDSLSFLESHMKEMAGRIHDQGEELAKTRQSRNDLFEAMQRVASGEFANSVSHPEQVIAMRKVARDAVAKAIREMP